MLEKARGMRDLWYKRRIGKKKLRIKVDLQRELDPTIFAFFVHDTFDSHSPFRPRHCHQLSISLIGS